MSETLHAMPAAGLPAPAAPLSSLDWVFKALIYLSFFLMLVVPTTLQSVRGVILSVSLLGVGFAVIKGCWRIHKDIALLFSVCMAISLVWMFRGLLAGGEGAVRVGTVYVVWPLLYMLYCGLSLRVSQAYPFLWLITLATIVVSLMGLSLVAGALGFQISWMSGILDLLDAKVGIYEGYIEYTLVNMATLMFSLPCLVALVLLPKNEHTSGRLFQFLVWAAIILAFAAMIVSGRKSFWLVGVLSPAIAGMFIWTAKRPIGRVVKFMSVSFLLLCVFAAVAFPLLGISHQVMVEAFVAGFDFSGGGEASATLRGQQFVDLIDGWSTHPLVGAGHGTSAPAIIRSTDMPWAYELSYVALLFQVGVIGFFFYSVGVVWVVLMGVACVRRHEKYAYCILPLLSGLVGFLICNATNPYLAKFDYLWTIFLPVAVINACLNETRKSIS